VNGLRVRAAGAEDSVRPRRLIGRVWPAPQLHRLPNRWLGTPDLIQLLRVRYFLPFRALPEGSQLLEPWVRATLLAA